MEVGPTEETIKALLDFFVEPLLKSKAAPSISQHQLIAKQVHAVVLLYNYYHRKCYPALEILTFESFCKLAIVLEPNLMRYMNLMHQSNYFEIDDLENQLSLTEKAIMDACDISLALDASKQVSEIESWPISKVAILLINSRKEKCLLSLGTATAGVWSLVEKDLDIKDLKSESKTGKKRIYKTRSSTKTLATANQNAREELQKLALLTVEEVTGISDTDLLVLGSHAVYSLSKKETAARFYILQCAQPSNKEFLVPIRDLVKSLQGPLVKKSSSGWVVTSVVEYFQILPYLRIIQEWFSREMPPNIMQDLEVQLENMHQINSPLVENSYEAEFSKQKDVSTESYVTSIPLDGKIKPQIDESAEKKETKECQNSCLSNKVDKPSVMDFEDLSVLHSENKDNCQNSLSVEEVDDQQQNMSKPVGHNYVPMGDLMTEAEMVDSMSRSCATGVGDEKIVPNKQYSVSLPAQVSIRSVTSNSQHLERLESILASRGDALSQTALRILLRKREKLSHQLRNLMDEICLCDKTIQTIQQGYNRLTCLEGIKGGDSHLYLENDFMIQVGNHMCHERREDTQPENKRKTFSEAIPSMRNPCQELDDICHLNNWKLPTYHVFPSDGRFESSVTLKGFDFELTIKGIMHLSSHDARESAATNMITKLRSLVGRTE